ncbi:MAG: hypothetical protein Fur0022_15250 [Anaerolineales bacterium]
MPLPTPYVIPFFVLVGYIILAFFLVKQRNWRSPDISLLLIGLGLSAVWVLTVSPSGLEAILPTINWPFLEPFFFLALGIIFLEFTRAFLQQPNPSILNWTLAAGGGIALFLLTTNWVRIPAFSFLLGPLQISDQTVLPLLKQLIPTIFMVSAWGAILTEYLKRRSPLHRNRMLYWMLSTTGMITGAWLLIQKNWGWGIGLHWLGIVLMVYTVIHSRLSDLATGVRRVIRYALTILVPIIVAIGLSSGIFYLVGSTQLYPLRLTTDAVFSMVLTGGLLFFLYQPLSQITRKISNRLLFGQRYEAETVLREYSQAISQVIALEGLTAAIMGIFQKAFETQRGTLLVMDDMDERGWYLKVLPGLGVPFGEPRLFLRKNSPLAQWFADSAEPLHQYFLDVDPRFQEQNSREMQEWRQLNMEVFLPVRRSDAVIGVIALGLRRAGRPYTTSELTLLQTLADQTGIALENATLFDSVQQRANQLTLLNEIGRVITSSLDLEPTIQLIAKRIENAFKGMAGFIFLMDETQQELILNTIFGTKRTLTSALRVGPGRGLVGWVAQNGQPALAYDLQADSRYDSQVEGFLVPKGRAALCVPVLAQNQTIGVILLVDATRTSLGPTELSLLDAIAAYASIAISNARQVAAREAQLRRQVESLRIEVDELKREQHVDEIVGTEFFQGLRQRASQLRRRTSPSAENPHQGEAP